MNEEPHKLSRKQRILKVIHLFISHHEPPYMHRCWRIPIGGRTLYICARCSSLVAGILLAFNLNLLFFRIEVNPVTFFGAFLLSLPAVIDWSSQTLWLRESRNPIRAITGVLLGIAVGFVLTAFSTTPLWPFYFILMVVLYSGYTLGFGALAPKITHWLRRRRTQQQTQATFELPPMLPPAHEDTQPNQHEE